MLFPVASPDLIRQQVKRVQCGESLSDEELKQIMIGLRNSKNQSVQPGELITSKYCIA